MIKAAAFIEQQPTPKNLVEFMLADYLIIDKQRRGKILETTATKIADLMDNNDVLFTEFARYCNSRENYSPQDAVNSLSATDFPIQFVLDEHLHYSTELIVTDEGYEDGKFGFKIFYNEQKVKPLDIFSSYIQANIIAENLQQNASKLEFDPSSRLFSRLLTSLDTIFRSENFKPIHDYITGVSTPTLNAKLLTLRSGNIDVYAVDPLLVHLSNHLK